MDANRPTHTSTKIQSLDGVYVEINPNTKEGFDFLLEHKDSIRNGGDRAIALIHCLDLSTKYGQRSASFLVLNVFNQRELNAGALVNRIDPNTYRGRQIVKALADRHKNPKSQVTVSLETVKTLLSKIDPSNIHGSKSVRHLVSAGLISEDLELLAVKRPKGVEVDVTSPDRGDIIEFLTSQRLRMNIPASLNGELSAVCATFAADRRAALGRAPINPITRR